MKDPDICRGPLDMLLPIAVDVGLSTLAAFVVSNEWAFIGAGGVAYTVGPTGGDAVDSG